MEDASLAERDDSVVAVVRDNLRHLMDGGTYAATINFDEKKAEGLYSLGHAQYLQGHFSEAMKFFGFIMALDPLNYRAMKAMAACMQMTRKYGQALLLLGILLVAEEDNKETSLQIINCLFHLGRYAEALKVIDAIEPALAGASEDTVSQLRVNGYREMSLRALALS